MSKAAVKKRWILPAGDRDAVRSLSESLALPGVVAELLVARDIRTPDEARRFLEAEQVGLSDPYELTDISIAVERLRRAKTDGEHVRVLGDYDVDGIAATALMTRALRRFGIEQASAAIPHRIRDGYGLSPDLVRRAHEDGVSLIVTVDNGISEHDAAAEAQRLGVDLVITDHHAIEGDLPPALAVVNPKREQPGLAFADLCGTAVAFKLATALNDSMDDLDMVALATVADVVPLRAENRTLVALGLESIRRGAAPGIAALARVARVDPAEIRAETIAFQLAPRINAAGRLGSAQMGLDLLMTESPSEAKGLARDLDKANRERRRLEGRILEDAEALLAGLSPGDRATIVLSSVEWHPGVIGVVASRLQEKYALPVAMIAIDKSGVGRASARSTPNFDLSAGVSACQDLLLRFGGHRGAAGFSIEAARIPEFSERFEAYAREHRSEDDGGPALNIDALLSFSEIDHQLLHSVGRLEPFGNANPTPVFGVFGAEIVPASVKNLKDNHVRCAFRQANRTFSAIGFGMADHEVFRDVSANIDIAFTPQINTWRGARTIQFNLKDLRRSDDA